MLEKSSRVSCPMFIMSTAQIMLTNCYSASCTLSIKIINYLSKNVSVPFQTSVTSILSITCNSRTEKEPSPHSPIILQAFPQSKSYSQSIATQAPTPHPTSAITTRHSPSETPQLIRPDVLSSTQNFHHAPTIPQALTQRNTHNTIKCSGHQ